MIITPAGNVGIGTTLPSTTLNLVGNSSGTATQILAQQQNSAGKSAITAQDSSGGYVQLGTDGPSYGYTFYQNSGAITFGNTALNVILTDEQTNTGGTAPFYIITGGYANTPTVTVTGGNPGSVGIGTTSPSATLQVNGTVQLGSSGTAVHGMGTCSIASFTAGAGANSKTCTGVASGSPIYCSPGAAPTTATVTWGARASASNTVVINSSAAFGTATRWVCMFMNP